MRNSNSAVLKLGRLELAGPYLLAPMSTMSDIGLRHLCSDYGASYSFTEQIFASEFVTKSDRMKRKLDLFAPCGIQFLTNSPEELARAISIIEKREFYPNLGNVHSIDLNLGCPSPKIMQQKMGSQLLKDQELVRELFTVMKENSSVPVSAKIRLGVSVKHKKTKPYLQVAKIAEEVGLDFITIHGRTSGQGYEGKVDTKAILETAAAVSIPVVGNGNVVDKQSADLLLRSCKAVMIGRKAVDEPFVFGQLLGKKYDKEEEKIRCVRKYKKYVKKYNIGFQIAKVHLQALLKDTKYKREMMGLTHCKDMNNIHDVLKNVV